MPNDADSIELGEHELREIAGYAAQCARRVLPLYERGLPVGAPATSDAAGVPDARPRAAVEAAEAFAAGGRRTSALRQAAWA
ncbi:hypothetical protein OKJ48_04925, partial [Streptomyces kunmingensis]|nr:hypothetical protein [Streptomyces kunmingensis]